MMTAITALCAQDRAGTEGDCGTMFTKSWRWFESSVNAAEIYVHCIERISNSPSLTVGSEWRSLWQIYNIVCTRDPVR
jgi:hypothetical protein